MIYLAQYRVQLRAVANTVMILWVPYNTEYFLSSWGLIGSQEGLCSMEFVSYLVTLSSVSYRLTFLRVSGLRPFKLWQSRVCPVGSVTLRTPNARHVADIVGVSHGSKGKRSYKRIEAGKDSRDEVTFWLASFSCYTKHGVCSLINCRASWYIELPPERSVLEVITRTLQLPFADEWHSSCPTYWDHRS